MTRETKVGIVVASIFLLLLVGVLLYKIYVLGEGAPVTAQSSASQPALQDEARAPSVPPPAQAPAPAPPNNLAAAPPEAPLPGTHLIAWSLQRMHQQSAEAVQWASQLLADALAEPRTEQTSAAQPASRTDAAGTDESNTETTNPPALVAPPPPATPSLAGDTGGGSEKKSASAQTQSENTNGARMAPPALTSTQTSQTEQTSPPNAPKPPVTEPPAANAADAPRPAAMLNPPLASSPSSDRRSETSPAKLRPPDGAPGGGIPVTIRTQPDLPVAPAPTAPTTPPRTRNNGVRPAAQVEDYDVTLYTVRPGDNYASISQASYGADSYQKALAAFNNELEPQSAALVSGKQLRIPPKQVLERRYRNLIPGLPDVPPEAVTDSTVPDAPRQPARLLTTLGPEQNTTGLGSPRINAALPANATAKDAAQADWAKETKPYKVRASDTIWSIAKQTLGKGERWPEISRLNRDVLPDVNHLRVGMTLRLPADAKLDTAETPQ